MKKHFIFLVFAVSAAQGGTGVLFPSLLSNDGSVLMTNAEFRIVSGSKLVFLSEAGYKSFESTNLSDYVLTRLGLSVSQIASNKQAQIDKQHATDVAQKSYQESLVMLAGTNQQIQIVNVLANFGMMKCDALVNGSSQQILVKNLPVSVSAYLDKYHKLQADIVEADALLDQYTRDAERADAVAPKGLEMHRTYTTIGNTTFENADSAEVAQRKRADLMLQKAKEYRVDVDKLHKLLVGWTQNDLTNSTTITAYPLGQSYLGIPIWQGVSK